MRQNRSPQGRLPSVKKRVKGTAPKKAVPYYKRNRRQKLSNSFRPSRQSQQIAKTDVITQIKNHATVNMMTTKHAGPKYLVNASIFNSPINMLLDSGSQVNIVNQSHCPEDVLANLAPSPVTVNAYNGSSVDILGVFETDVYIGQICIKQTPVFVTTNAFKPILGTPALDQLKIDFQAKQISNHTHNAQIRESASFVDISNINLKTTEKRPDNRTLQLYAGETVKIPPNSEIVLNAQIQNDYKENGLWATEPQTCLVKNCIVAKSVSRFSRHAKKAVIRLCNVSTTTVEVPRKAPIVKVSPVIAVAPKTSNAANVLNDVKIGNVAEPHRKDIIELLNKYADVFAEDDKPLNKTAAAEFDIDTGSSPPISQQKYRTPYFLRNELRKIIDKNVKHGLMEECSSPWAAPTLLVKKPNGSWRLVCDYRKLNTVTTGDAYPLPEINDCVNELSESRIFSTTDLYSGFHQIPTSNAAKQKLAVITDFGQYTWCRMPMGAKNCPAVFQRMMDKCFRQMPLSSLVVYLDDVLIHSKTITEHISKLEELFQILRSNNLQIRGNKTVIATNEVTFCGYRIKDGVKYPNTEKIKAVKELRIPQSPKSAQMIFGLLNYHRAFIKDFARKAAPITKTYNSKGRFCWPKEANDALNLLKTEICDAALRLTIPCLKTSKFVLETDACDTGYAGTLFICKNKEEHGKHNSSCLRPVEYMSCQFTPAQSRYYIQEKELYSGKEAMRKWRHYLLGRQFDWQIDNACLKWAHRIRSSKPRISQWLAEISEFDARTILKPSSQMKVTDCLSRQFAEINTIRISRSEITNLQENDPELKKIRNFAAIDRWPSKATEDVDYFKKHRSSIIFGRAGEMLVRDSGIVKLAVPDSIKREIIKTYHDDVGHPGIEKTITDISSRYIWPSLDRDVSNFVKTCHKCQISKPNLKPKQPPLGESETPSQPFEYLAFDLIGPLPTTDNENKYAIVGLDLFTKRVYAAPLPTKHAEFVLAEIERIVFSNPFPPKTILTDNGTEFAGLQQFCHQYNIRHSQSPPYHPQTNGAVERMNQTLKQRLFEVDEEETWDERLSRIVHAINCSKNAVTQSTPFQLETGFRGRNMQDQIEITAEPSQNIQDLHKSALERILMEKASRVERKQNPKFVPFSVGDLVLAKNHTQKFPRYTGPYVISKVRGDGLSYEIKQVDGFGTQIRAVTDLKAYHMHNEETSQPQASVNDEEEEEPETSLDMFDDDDDFGINFFAPPAPRPPSNDEGEQQIDNEDEIDQIDNVDNDDNHSDKTNETGSVILSDPDGTELPSGLSDEIDEIVTDGIVTDQEEHLFSDEEIGQLEESVYESAAEQSDENADHNVTVVQNEEPPEMPSTSNEQAQNEHLFNDQLYLQRKSGKVSPKPDVKFEMPLYQLTSKELHDLGNQFKINLTGTVFQQKQQLDEFITQKFPTHKRTHDGHLIFGCTFDPAVKKNLKEHSLVELKAIIKAYNLPSPSLLFTKKDVYKHVKKHLLKKYPNSLVNGDIVFSRSRGGSPTN